MLAKYTCSNQQQQQQQMAAVRLGGRKVRGQGVRWRVAAAASAGGISADARLVYLQQRRLLSLLPLPKALLLIMGVVAHRTW
jgi:hypothetical protein